MHEYLTKIKNLCDQLAFAGNKVRESDQALYILSG